VTITLSPSFIESNSGAIKQTQAIALFSSFNEKYMTFLELEIPKTSPTMLMLWRSSSASNICFIYWLYCDTLIACTYSPLIIEDKIPLINFALFSVEYAFAISTASLTAIGTGVPQYLISTIARERRAKSIL